LEGEDGEKEADHQFLIQAEIVIRLLLSILTKINGAPSLRGGTTKQSID
jgi:hypothetical protein